MRITYSQTALDDLSRFLICLCDVTSVDFAVEYVGKIEAFCETLATMPLRGTSRISKSRRYRFIVFKKRIVIADSANEEVVTILSIYTKGRWATKKR